MIALKTTELYGDTAIFSRLSRNRQNEVYAAIVKSAGKPDPNITRSMARLSHAGRGLLFLSIGVSLYNIATSTNKATAIKKEIATQGSGVAGGLAGGALAGLACGPGAPICVTVGAFVGGALAAFGTSYYW